VTGARAGALGRPRDAGVAAPSGAAAGGEAAGAREGALGRPRARLGGLT